MVDFKVGDRVLCIDGHINTHSGDNLISGNEYTINSIRRCRCGSISIDVGLKVKRNSYTICRTCNDRYNPVQWFLRPTRFTKIDGRGESIDVSEFMGIFTTTIKKIDVD